MTKLLFVCSRNRLRSPTAEAIFGQIDGIEVMSAGTAPDADCVLSADMIEWADVILVMEASHRQIVTKKYSLPLRGKKLVCLGIRDVYEYMDERLVAKLWATVPNSVPALAAVRPQ